MSPFAKARDVGCADELRRNFENSRHVGMLASVLLAVYANQLWNRCLCAFSGSRMPGFGSRAFRALQVWLLWMLLSQPSLLATPVALQLSANWFARDATCLVHHRKNIKTNAIRCIQLACGLHTAHASYSYRNSECEGILAVALCFWVGLLDATIVAHRLLANKYLKLQIDDSVCPYVHKQYTCCHKPGSNHLQRFGKQNCLFSSHVSLATCQKPSPYLPPHLYS